MIRSFVGVGIPEEVADALEDLQEGLPGANWTPAENFHITLAFLGEQPSRALEDLDAELAAMRAAPFELRLSGVAVFGPDARLAYAGVGASEPLKRLRDKTHAAARACDIDVDARKFAPHVTLARWRRGEVRQSRLEGWLAARNLFASAPFSVDALTLYRSTLTRDGPIYEPMAVYPLA